MISVTAKSLKSNEETASILKAALDMFQYADDIYKNDFPRIARMIDEGGSAAEIDAAIAGWKKKKGMTVYGYVIMSNHIHLIIHSKDGKLSDSIRDFKKFTAKTILEKIQAEPESRRDWMLERFKIATESHSRNKNYQFWQYGNHAEEIYSEKFMRSKLDYIHLNLFVLSCVKASDYIYSSASKLCKTVKVFDYRKS
ncbi:hypothetical protein FQR65_LT19859 [Abscondita terminalis]|nr:hypothetical protein FQR65_LT19859 [Abscondita terminalis]